MISKPSVFYERISLLFGKLPKSFDSYANALAWISGFLFLSGGLTLKFAFSQKPRLLEINQWGLLLLPLFVLVVLNCGNWRDLSFVRLMQRLWPYLGQKHFATILGLLICGMHFLAMIHRHESFQSEWDLTIYANACSNGLHSSLRNHTNILADHFEPILLIITPFCSTVNPVLVLLASQCIAWLIGAIGIKFLAKSEGWSDSLSTVVMALYLVFSGNQTTSYYDFHPYGWALGTIPWIWYGVTQSRYLILFLAAGIHVALKENTSLFLVGLGLLLVFQKRFRTGLLLVAFGLMFFILIMKVAFPYFRGGQESEYFAKYYGHLGHTLSEMTTNIFFEPWRVVQSVMTFDKLRYLTLVFTPFLFIHFFMPSFILPIAGALLIATLSNVPVMYSGNFHYEAEIYAWLFASAITIAASDIWSNRVKRILSCFKISSPQSIPIKLLFVGFMTVFFSGTPPHGRIAYYTPSRPQVEVSSQLDVLRHKLSNCKVATVERVAPHLASIPYVTMLNDSASANAIVVAYPQGNRLWIQDISTIENDYVPKWNQEFVLHQPLSHDQDFRVWTKPPCEYL